jgi:hypothetical protein
VSILRTSPDLAKLADALCKAQSAFPTVTKGKTAEVVGENKKSGQAVRYSYAYADLADIIEAIRPALAANGLSYVQPIVQSNGDLRLVTRLLHTSGQWIESVYPLESYDKPQEMGSAITYARRYALTALIGVAAEEDDDGATAQASERAPKSSRPECPKCKTARAVIEGRDEYGGGWVCFKKKGGCGAKWHDDARPAKDSHANGEDASGATEISDSVEPSGTAGAFVCPHCASENVSPDGPRYMRCLNCNKGYPKPAA